MSANVCKNPRARRQTLRLIACSIRFQIQLSNAGRRHTTTNGGFDLNPASNILRDENEDKLNHNVINLEGWVAPMDQIDNEKNAKYDNLQDTKL